MSAQADVLNYKMECIQFVIVFKWLKVVSLVVYVEK